MEHLLSMGFPQELASQALAATGGTSTLKATEWLLSHRADAHSKLQQSQQARVDRFFSPHRLRDSAGDGTDAKCLQDGKDSVPVGPREASPSLLSASHSKAGGRFGQAGTVQEQGKACGLAKAEGEKRSLLGVSSLAVTEQFGDGGDPVPGKRLNPFPPSVGASMEPSFKRQRVEEEADYQPPAKTPVAGALVRSPAGRKSSKVPLAERMRPVTIDEIVGQDHLLGPGCILRSVLQSDTVPSVIFWGPPGTGKTSLARAIARSVSYRFVTASAVTSGVKEVREILEEAKRQKKMGQRTLFFVDEVHRFNKAQQDAFLPSVEAGHVVFIGATTENPSFEVNGALLSRCRVLTLNKLQPESIKKLLERALSNTERGVLASFVDDPIVKRVKADDEALQFLAGAADGDARVALNALEVAVAAAASRAKLRSKPSQDASPNVMAERNDAWMGNSVSVKESSRSVVTTVKRELPLKLSALKERLDPSQEEYKRPFKRFVRGRQVTSYNLSKENKTAFQVEDDLAETAGEGTNPLDPGMKSPNIAADPRDVDESAGYTGLVEEDGEILVSFVDVAEALQRSHLLYDKTGEEHYNIISALHKSMRGGDPDAALYWLARMLEGGEGPLYVARRLIRFASEDVGLADPNALTQAVACYQACHFLGMPECNVHLAQCVAYLSLAPKSVAVYQAIEAAQQIVKATGQNEPVPLHLRNAPTGLMKQLGYGKGYIYPPNFEGPVEQEYLPPSLQGHKFLKWP